MASTALVASSSASISVTAVELCPRTARAVSRPNSLRSDVAALWRRWLGCQLRPPPSHSPVQSLVGRDRCRRPRRVSFWDSTGKAGPEFFCCDAARLSVLLPPRLGKQVGPQFRLEPRTQSRLILGTKLNPALLAVVLWRVDPGSPARVDITRTHHPDLTGSHPKLVAGSRSSPKPHEGSTRLPP